jgi:ATP-dependent exoDNAse (exonuclease V) alpha subunit
VLAIAPTSKSRDVLRGEGFETAETVAAFLASPVVQERVRGGVLLVDEAGMLGTRQLKALFDLTEQLDTRVVLVGDPRQHHAVERGDGMRLLIESGALDVAELSAVRRQSGLYKDAVNHLAQGRAEEAMEVFDDMGAIHEIENDRERFDALADRYVEQSSKGKTVLVVAPTHSESREATHAIRQKLKERGRLKNERGVSTLRPLSLTVAERQSLVSYESGMVIQFQKSAKGIKPGARLEVIDVSPAGVLARDESGKDVLLDVDALAERFQVYEQDVLPVGIGERIRITQNGKSNGHRLTNGSIYTVAGFDKSGGIKLDNGMTLDRDWKHFDQGHVVTSYASQGLTTDEVIIALSEDSLVAANLETVYVAASRGRSGVAFYTHNRDELLEVARVLGKRQSALELVERTPPIAIRQPVKTGLGEDPLPRRKLVEPLRNEARQRQREFELSF